MLMNNALYVFTLWKNTIITDDFIDNKVFKPFLRDIEEELKIFQYRQDVLSSMFSGYHCKTIFII